jgi:aspartate carbamoyltransferase catalytic subunit
MTQRPSHLTSIQDFSRDDVMAIFKKADAFQKSISKSRLANKLLINFFFENSTRTRVSFEIAAKRLGMDVTNFSPARSSVTKGEDLADTLATIRAMQPDGIVVRHPQSGAAQTAAQIMGKIPVINAGDGAHEHPTQALLDAYTIQKRFGTLKGLHLGIIGDIDHSRVARSNMLLLKQFGTKITVCGPKAMIPAGISQYGVGVTHDLDALLPRLDVIMMLRIQTERAGGQCIPSTSDYARLYQLNAQRLARARSEAIVMHPGPMNRGVEISNDVADGSQSVISDQVANGVLIRMAVLDYLL